VTLSNPSDGGPKLVRLQAVHDRIIRVSATPEDVFTERKSLIIVDQGDSLPTFTVERQDSLVILKTEQVTARVSVSDGSVAFTDQQGHVLLTELPGGGKSFRPLVVESKAGYSFRQVFDSPDEEAFFGLGQHQSDEWNYKGRNEVLYQYNTKVSVPMVVSSRNYGILWDNYSLTKWGDPRDYAQMDQFTLYGADGKIGGLTATYRQDDGKVSVQH